MSDSIFFGMVATIAFYALGLALQKRYRSAILNPTLISAVCLIAVFGHWEDGYAAYQPGGEILSQLLTPATVCLALPLYERLRLLQKHWKAVLVGLLCGVLSSLLSTLLLCKLMKLSPDIYATLLPKSITSAIGMGVSEELGGITSLTMACTVLTGIFGSMVCEAVFKLCRIHSPIAKGLAIGASSHALGTAKAAQLGQTEAAMSTLALVVCGLLTVVLAPVFYTLL